MKRRFSDVDVENDTPDTVIDSDDESVDSEVQALIDAISEHIAKGDWETASELIDENRVDINSISSCGDSFLHAAISHGHLNIVRDLLSLEADPNVLNQDGLRPLSLAIDCDRGEAEAIIKELLQHGANPNLANDDGMFPIHLALEQSGLEILKLLTGYNKLGLSTKRILGEKDLLHYFIKLNLPDGASILQFLISHGDLDVNAVNGFGATPLHEAARSGNIPMIRELLRYMPDTDIRDYNGNAAFELAANAEVAHILREYDRLEGQELADFVYNDYLPTTVASAAPHHHGDEEEDHWVAQLSSYTDEDLDRILGEVDSSSKFFADSKPSGL